MEVLKSRKSTCWAWNCLKVTVRECKTLSHPCSCAAIADVAPSSMSKHSAPIYLGLGGGAKSRAVQCRNVGVKLCVWVVEKWKVSLAMRYIGSSIQVEGNWLSPVGKLENELDFGLCEWCLVQLTFYVVSVVPPMCIWNIKCKCLLLTPLLWNSVWTSLVRYPYSQGPGVEERDWTMLCHSWGCLSTRQALDDTAEAEWLHIITSHMQLWPWDSSAGCGYATHTNIYADSLYFFHSGTLVLDIA